MIKAIRFCWDLGVYFYPVVISGQSSSLKVVPKVKIAFKQGSKDPVEGKLEYNQNDELYDKIRELYLHKYNQLNRVPKEVVQFQSDKKDCVNWNGNSCRYNCTKKCLAKQGLNKRLNK